MKTLGYVLLGVVLLAPAVVAQRTEPDLSDKEVERLRDAAYFPNDRVLVFVEMLDARSQPIEEMFSKPRKPGREQDVHDLLEQFTAVAEELEDNLDDYSKQHRDVRKSLPKLLKATDRWGTELRTPPEDEAYEVSRKLALETLHDLHDEAAEMIEEQRAWFAAHPPAKGIDGQPAVPTR